MPLPYPLTFYGSKVFRFSSPIFRLPEPTPDFTGSFPPFFREPAQSPKRQLLTKKEIYRRNISFPKTADTSRHRQTKNHTYRKEDQSAAKFHHASRHFINQRRKSFRQLRKDYFTTHYLHDKTDFLYSILRIQSKNIISYCLPSPILRRIFLTNLFSMQNGISHSRTSASSASSEAPMHQNKKDPEQKMSGVFYQVFTDLQFKLLQQLLRKEFLQKLPCEV